MRTLEEIIEKIYRNRQVSVVWDSPSVSLESYGWRNHSNYVKVYHGKGRWEEHCYYIHGPLLEVSTSAILPKLKGLTKSENPLIIKASQKQIPVFEAMKLDKHPALDDCYLWDAQKAELEKLSAANLRAEEEAAKRQQTLDAELDAKFAEWLSVVQDHDAGLFSDDNMAFQLEKIKALVKLAETNKNSLLVAPTGAGKTFIVGGFIDYLIWSGSDIFADRFIHFAYVCPLAVVMQVKDDFKRFPHLKDAKRIIVNYEDMRTANGFLAKFVEAKERTLPNGQVETTYHWLDDKSMVPAIFCFDECQKLKNASAQQTQIARALNNISIEAKPLQVMFSATPFAKPIETGSLALALESEYRYGRVKDEESFNAFLREVGRGKDPREASPTFMGDLRDRFEDHIVQVRASELKFKHRTFNHPMMLEFKDDEQRDEYNRAKDELKRGIEDLIFGARSFSYVHVLVLLLRFRQKAELLKAEMLAEEALRLEAKGFNVIIGFNFIETLEKVQDIIGADKVSVIRGGQKPQVRHEEKTKFQDERTHICLLMMKAGGAGLSLHHNKTNNRPRRCLLGFDWDAISMIQVVGRAHRINSESTTRQYVVGFKGTVEERVFNKVLEKSASLKGFLERKESAGDMFLGELLGGKAGNLDFAKLESELRAKDVENAGDDEDNDGSEFWGTNDGVAENMVTTNEESED